MKNLSREPIAKSFLCELFRHKMGDRVAVDKENGYYECKRCGMRKGFTTSYLYGDIFHPSLKI